MIKVLLLSLIVQSTFEWIPKYIWTYWHDPIQQSSQLIKAFHNNHVQFTYGWQHRHIDKNNFWFWFDLIPNFRQRIQSEAWKGQGRAKLTDIMRIALINHFGGVYFDMTTILTRNLDWIIQMKDQKLFIVNGTQYQEPDLFIHYAANSNGPKIYDQKTKNNIPIIPNLEGFFLAGKAKNRLLNEWLQKAFELKQQSYKLYGHDQSKSLLIQKALIQGTLVSYNTETNNREIIIVGSNIIYNKQKQLQKKSSSLNSKNQPLALRYYNLILMNALDSGYHLVSNCIQEECLTRLSLNELKERDIYPSYFVKLDKNVFNQLKKYTMMPNLFCQKESYILRDSVLYQFVLKGYKKKIYFKDVLNSVKEYYPYYCPLTMVAIFFSFICLILIILWWRECKCEKSRQKWRNGHSQVPNIENDRQY